MKTFIPIFITSQDDLSEMIRSVRLSGYKIDEEDISCVIDNTDKLNDPDYMTLFMNDVASQMAEKIVDRIEHQSYFSVIICLDLLSPSIASFMVDAIESIRSLAGLSSIKFAFCPPSMFGQRVAQINRSLFVTGTYYSGYEEAAKLISEHTVEGDAPFTLVKRYISESSFELHRPLIRNKSMYNIVSDMYFDVIKDNLMVPIESAESLPMSGSGWLIDDMIKVADAGNIAVVAGTPAEAYEFRQQMSGASVLFYHDIISTIMKNKDESDLIKPMFDQSNMEIFISMIEGAEDADMTYSPIAEDEDKDTLRRNLIGRIAGR